MLCRTQKMNFACLILRSLWASENGQNLLTKMASEGVKESDARISNRRVMKNVCLLFLSITPPNLSMMLVWAFSVDPFPLTFFNILPGFLKQPLLNIRWYVNRFNTYKKKLYFLNARPFFIKEAKNHGNRLKNSCRKTLVKNITNVPINRFGPP